VLAGAGFWAAAGMSCNLASLASVAEDDLECVEALLRARSPRLAAAFKELLQADVDEELACRAEAGDPGAAAVASHRLPQRPTAEAVGSDVQTLQFLDLNA
jgi:hypothetical protein